MLSNRIRVHHNNIVNLYVLFWFTLLVSGQTNRPLKARFYSIHFQTKTNRRFAKPSHSLLFYARLVAMFTQLFWGWSYLGGKRNADTTLLFTWVQLSSCLAAAPGTKDGVGEGGAARNSATSHWIQASDKWQKGTKDQVRHHQHLIMCRLHSLCKAGNTKVGSARAALLQHRKQHWLYLDCFTVSRFIKPFISCPSLSNCGINWNPLRNVL